MLNKKFMKSYILKTLPKTVNCLLGVYIFFIPFPHTTAIKEFCFYVSIAILSYLIFSRRISLSFKTPLTFPFLLLIVWNLFDLLFALDKGNSLHDLIFHLVKYVIIFFLTFNFFNSEKKFKVLTWIVICSNAIFSLGAIVYFYGIQDNPISARLGLGFLEMHVDYIGFATLLSIFLILNNFNYETNKSEKLIYSVCLIFLCAATVLTQSKGTFLAAFIGFLILFKNKIKVYFTISILFVLIIIFMPGLRDRFAMNNIIDEYRIGIYLTNLEIIKAYPITGIGFGMQTYDNSIDLETYNDKIPPRYKQKKLVAAPHSSFFDIAVRTGIIGLILFIIVLIKSVQMNLEIIRTNNTNISNWGLCLFASFISIIIQNLFSDGMFGPQALFLYTIFSMITVLWELNNKTENPES